MRPGDDRPTGIRAHELRRTVERLRAYETPDERLVSVYLPADTPVREAAARLTRMRAETDGLPAATETATREAVGSLRDRLGEYDAPPANGLALFAGRLDEETILVAVDSLPAPVDDLRVERHTTFDLAPAVDLLPEPTVERDRELLGELAARANDETAVVGFAPTRRNLDAGAVERLLVAEGFHGDVVWYECPNGHTTRLVVARDRETPAQDCTACGETGAAAGRETAVEHLFRLARRHDTDVTFVSTAVEGGDRLASEGVGALLRYRTGL